MIAAALLGALVGLGVVLVWVGLHPRDEALVAVLGRLGQPLPPRSVTTRARSGSSAWDAPVPHGPTRRPWRAISGCWAAAPTTRSCRW
jgi:hypothetical protein